MPYIPRHMESVLSRYDGEFPAILLSGARQTGKTTLLRRFTSQKAIPYITFDDMLEEMSANADPNNFMRLHPAPQMFDEIQYVPDLFRYIKMAVDANRGNGMFYLTESQQFPLAKSASESLAGRVGILHMYPLSDREIMGSSFHEPFISTLEYVQKRQAENTQTRPTIWEKIIRGGYPEVVQNHLKPQDFYENYLRTYIERDIRSLTQVADEMQFLQFITVAAARTGSLVNYNDMAKDVGISQTTAKKWLSLLVTSGLIYLLYPFSLNVEKRVIKTPKMYFMDTGLVAYLTRWISPEILERGAMAGNFFETYVISEIVKSYVNDGFRPPLYFYRDKDKIEIDLLIHQDNTLYPVEIKKTATPTAHDARNFHVMNRIKDTVIAPACIICNCSAPVFVKKEVLALPVGLI